MAYIHVYTTPTAGGTDGTQVSEGTGLQPISVTLNATNNEESTPIKLALRCDSDFQTNGNITISVVGTTLTKWALAPDNARVAGVLSVTMVLTSLLPLLSVLTTIGNGTVMGL